jgi:hypothetical protein
MMIDSVCRHEFGGARMVGWMLVEQKNNIAFLLLQPN